MAHIALPESSGQVRWVGFIGLALGVALVAFVSLSAYFGSRDASDAPGTEIGNGTSGLVLYLSIGLLAVAMSAAAPFLKKTKAWDVARPAVRGGLLLLVGWWLIWGAGHNIIEWLLQDRRPLRPGIHYANPARVVGLPAPSRTLPPTNRVQKSDRVWEVSIDGTNEYRLREGESGHFTGIWISPGQLVRVRHLGGILAYNSHGDRFPLCGDGGGGHPGESFRYPKAPPQALGTALVPPNETHMLFSWWKCGQRESRLVWSKSSRGQAELVLFFNTNERYLTPQGPSAGHGFAFAGWDGVRAKFEVRLETWPSP